MGRSQPNADGWEPSGSSTSRSLLGRVKQEEPDGWSELVHLYSPLVMYWCQREGVPAHEREDVVQDVFRTVFINIGRFRKEKPTDTFRGWLRTIARSRIADHYRRQGREPAAAGGTEARVRLQEIAAPAGDTASEEVPDEATAERQLFLRAVGMIRAGFEERTWQAFWRVAVEGRSVQEAAEELGMRPGTVRVAKSRVLKRLRERLGDLLE
jgi:RNA polymerase sigma-70 factor, ECF subfamily